MLTPTRPGVSPHRWALLGAALLLLWCALGLLAAPSASAAPADPEEWTRQITDTQGVPLDNYRNLPLDRGDAWTAQKWFPAALMDLVWGAHVQMVQFVFSLLHILLSFEWVEWIAAPVNILAENVAHFTSQLHWIPVAAAILGAAVAWCIIRGRTGAGITELLIGALMIALAGGMLANPVQWITGPDGIFAKSQEYGGQAAVDITADPDNPPPANMPIEEALNHSIMSQLTDLFVRVPAQSISFGHALVGECDQVFTDNMKAVDPIDVEDTTVRARVSSCDDSAKAYVESPALTKVIPPVVVAIGGGILNLLGLAMAVAFFLAVVMALYHGVKQMVSVLLAILPATSRRGFFRSFVAVAVYALLVGLLMVLVASYLMVVVWVSKATSYLGIVNQMGMVVLFVLVLIVLLFVIWRRSVKSGEKLADRLASLGLASNGPAPRPVRFNPISKIEPYVRDAVNRKLLTRGFGKSRAPHTPESVPEQAPSPTTTGRSFTAPTAITTSTSPASLPGRAPQRSLPVGTHRPDSQGGNPGPSEPGPNPGTDSPTGSSPAGGKAPTSAKALRALSTGLSLVGGPTAVASGLLARGAAGAIEHRSHRATEPSRTSSGHRAPADGTDGTSERYSHGSGSRTPPLQRTQPWVSPQGRRIEVDSYGHGRVAPAAVEGTIVPANQGPVRPTQRARTAPSPETQVMRRRIVQARMAAAARQVPVGGPR